MASQPGRNIRNYISKNRFFSFFDGLTAANKVQFFEKNRSLFQRFERKMRSEGKILIKVLKFFMKFSKSTWTF